MQLSTFLKILASVLLLAFLATRMDLTTLGRVLASASLLGLVLPVVIQMANVFISVKRWQTILENFGMNTPYFPMVRLVFIGQFFNLFLPSSIGGDFFRAYYLAREQKQSISATLTTTFMERSGGLCALLIIGILASSIQGLVIHEIRLFWVFLAGAGLYLAANIALFNRRLHGLVGRLLQRLKLENVEAKMELISRGLASLIHNSKAILIVLTISLIVQFFSVLMIWTCSWALHIRAPFSSFLVFVPLINLSIMVPLTINGFGLRESLYFLLFTQIGVNDEQAVALSLANAFVIMVTALPGAIFYSLQKKSERIVVTGEDQLQPSAVSNLVPDSDVSPSTSSQAAETPSSTIEP